MGASKLNRAAWNDRQAEAPLMERLDVSLRKMSFGTDKRKQMYRTLAILMRSGKLMIEAVDELYQVYSDGGRKPKQPIAIILAEVRDGLGAGATFSQAIRRYVGFDEFSVLSAGEEAGDLISSFVDATRVAEVKSKMVVAIRNGTAYPIALSLNLAALLWVVESKLVPALKSAADPEQWNGAATALYYLSSFVNLFGLPLVVFIAVSLCAFIYSLPRLTGNVRYYLDKVAGYNVYRVMNGCIFLMSLSSQLRHGVTQQEALNSMAEAASPYMHERIEATIAGNAAGNTLGEALERAGLDFPDREAIRVVKALGTNDGFERAPAEYSEEWMARTVVKVEVLMRAFTYAALIAVGATMICVVLGTQGIKEAVEAGYR